MTTPQTENSAAVGQSDSNALLGGTAQLIGADRIAEMVIRRVNKEASNSNFHLCGFDEYRTGLLVQALITVLLDEGLLVKPNVKSEPTERLLAKVGSTDGLGIEDET